MVLPEIRFTVILVNVFLLFLENYFGDFSGCIRTVEGILRKKEADSGGDRDTITFFLF